jgi:alpha-ketoglutaric semialdehyde dehydrogenase
MTLHPVLIAGRWRPAESSGTFSAYDPALGEKLPGEYPISRWADCDAALDAATEAAARLRTSPPEKIAAFLEAFARRV